MKSVKLVMVDCYGTMLHPPAIDAAVIESLRQYCAVEMISEEFRGLRAELTPQLKGSFISQRRRFDIIIAQLLIKLRLPPSIRSAVSAAVMDSFAKAPPYGDTVAALLELSRSVPITVVTNGDEQPVRSALQQLPAVFSDIVTSEAARCYKPDPAIFEFALSRSRCSASSVIVIGDDPDRDCAPARKLGMRTVHVDRDTSSEANGEVSFPSLAAVLPYISKLF